jgi:hypothetical protein
MAAKLLRQCRTTKILRPGRNHELGVGFGLPLLLFTTSALSSAKSALCITKVGKPTVPGRFLWETLEKGCYIMITILAGAALGAYTLRTALAIARDTSVGKVVGSVKAAVHNTIEDTKAGYAEGIARAQAHKANAAVSEDPMAKIFAAANDEDKAKIVEIISKYTTVEKAA